MGYIFTPFSGATTAGTSAVADLRGLAGEFTIQFDGLDASASLAVQGSLDGVLWSGIAQSPSGWTTGVAVSAYPDHFYRYVRAVLTGSPVGTVSVVVAARDID